MLSWLMARLFIGTLKGLAFEWFMKLPEGSIKNWGDLEKLFLTRFFEDDSEVTMPTPFWLPNSEKENPSNLSWKGFGTWHSGVQAV